jgi:hypothetical protein
MKHRLAAAVSWGLEVAGLGAIAYGAWLAWEPAGWILAGLAMLNLAYGRAE